MEKIRKDAIEWARKHTNGEIIKKLQEFNLHAYQENRQSVRRDLYTYMTEFLKKLEERRIEK